MSSVSPFKTTLTNILLPNPVFPTDSIGGLAALSQISPGSFDSTKSTLTEALAFGQSALPAGIATGAPIGSSNIVSPVIPVALPVAQVPSPAIEAMPVIVASPPPPVQTAPVREPDERNERFDRHPLGGPPGLLRKLSENDSDGPGRGRGNGNNGFRVENSGRGNGNGRLNRKGDFRN